MVGVAARLEFRVVQLLDRVVSEVTQVHHHSRHDSATVRSQQAAVVGGLELGEFFDMSLDVVGDPVQDHAPFGRREGGPSGERGSCGCDGRVGLGLSAASDSGDHGAVDRGDVIEGLGGGHAQAAYPVPGVDFDTGDDDRRHVNSSGGYIHGRSFGP